MKSGMKSEICQRLEEERGPQSLGQGCSGCGNIKKGHQQQQAHMCGYMRGRKAGHVHSEKGKIVEWRM